MLRVVYSFFYLTQGEPDTIEEVVCWKLAWRAKFLGMQDDAHFTVCGFNNDGSTSWGAAVAEHVFNIPVG